MTDCIHSIIDGFPDYLHKLALAERPTIPSPKRQRVETSVLGRLGGLVQDYSFEDMSFTLHYNYLEDVEDHQAFKQSFYIMRHWLNYAKKLEFSDDPNVYYIILDEYMLEDSSRSNYVSGWKEPDLLLSIYHTIDREEDRVKVFMLGNNTSFFNPYHLHPAFNIQPIKQGQIWTSENVLYQWAEGSKDLKEKRATSKFGKMIQNTRYGEYASAGHFIEDNDDFIAVHDGKAQYEFTIICGGIQYGVYADQNKGLVYISDKTDPSCPFVYALTVDDHTENVMLTKGKPGALEWFSKCIKIGVVRFENMYIKKLTEGEIYKLL